MSIVGTRPPTLDEWNKYELHHRARLNFVVMAQSPNYTPASADFIMDIIREYIIEI